jgi:hypothetical protein
MESEEAMPFHGKMNPKASSIITAEVERYIAGRDHHRRTKPGAENS